MPRRKNDERRVGSTDVLIAVPIDDRGRCSQIVGFDRREVVRPTTQFTQRLQLGVDTEPGGNQMVDFGHDVGRHDQRSGLLFGPAPL